MLIHVCQVNESDQLNLNVLFDVWSIVSDNECIRKIGAFDLHKAVRRVSNATGQQFTLQHRIHYSTLTIWCPNIKPHMTITTTTATATTRILKTTADA